MILPGTALERLFPAPLLSWRLWERWVLLPPSLQEVDDLLGELDAAVGAERYSPAERLLLLGARIWWDCGKPVHCFSYPDVVTLLSDASPIPGGPQIWHTEVPTIRRAMRDGRSWCACFSISDDRADPTPALGGAIIFDGAVTKVIVEVRMGRGKQVQLRAELGLVPGMITPDADTEALLNLEGGRGAVISEQLSFGIWCLTALAWAVETPFTRTEPKDRSMPKGLSRKRKRELLRRRRRLEASRPQFRKTTLVLTPEGLRRKGGAPPPVVALRSTGGGMTRETWAPAHTGIRWVHEDNVDPEEDLLDVKERNGRIYYACLRPIRGWGKGPASPRRIVYSRDQASRSEPGASSSPTGTRSNSNSSSR